MESTDICVLDFVKISPVAFLMLLLHFKNSAPAERENSFDCGLFLLHSMWHKAPATFNPCPYHTSYGNSVSFLLFPSFFLFICQSYEVSKIDANKKKNLIVEPY